MLFGTRPFVFWRRSHLVVIVLPRNFENIVSLQSASHERLYEVDKHRVTCWYQREWQSLLFLLSPLCCSFVAVRLIGRCQRCFSSLAYAPQRTLQQPWYFRNCDCVHYEAYTRTSLSYLSIVIRLLACGLDPDNSDWQYVTPDRLTLSIPTTTTTTSRTTLSALLPMSVKICKACINGKSASKTSESRSRCCSYRV